jgi:hypothetical protein
MWPLGRLRPLEVPEAKSNYRTYLTNLPPRNPCFTGREAYLTTIRRTLAQTGTVALGGIGGIGKTETAAEYAYRNRREYQAVLWASAMDASLLSGFALLCTPRWSRCKDWALVARAEARL